MKNISNYQSAKYELPAFEEIEPGIYKCDQGVVTSLSFEQEPDLGEGVDSSDISQYPLEDLLDQFCVYVSDFYSDINDGDSKVCCLEFCSQNLQSIVALRSIIGKRVFNKTVGNAGDEYIELVIE